MPGPDSIKDLQKCLLATFLLNSQTLWEEECSINIKWLASNGNLHSAGTALWPATKEWKGKVCDGPWIGLQALSLS